MKFKVNHQLLGQGYIHRDAFHHVINAKKKKKQNEPNC